MDQTLQLITWNILASGYIRPKYYPHTEPAHLLPESRHPRIVEALRGWAPDLCCLQEVEQPLFDAIMAALAPDGWRGQLAIKDGRREGVALVWRHAAVAVEQTHTLRYAATSKGHRSTALIAQVRPAGAPQPFILVSTHLAWAHRTTPPAEHPGCLQLSELLDVRDAGELFEPGLPWVVCGDLNDEPQGPVLAIAAARGLKMPCAQTRPWHTGNFNDRLVKLDYALADEHAPALRPHPLPALTKTTPMPGPDHPSDHLPLRLSLNCA